MVCALTACKGGGGGGAPTPAGWQHLSGDTWVRGAAAARQTYTYTKQPFSGTLQELAQREIVDNALHKLKFVKSDVYEPCPGVAAIATFSGARKTVEDGFAVVSGSAMVVHYERPANVPADSAAKAAMQRALCVAPA